MEKSKMICADQKYLQSGTEVSSQLCLSELPIAILHEILFKLPIISIMNLKFVSTSFYKLISDPNFAHNYSKNSPFISLLNYSERDLDPDLNLLELSDNNNNNLEHIQTTLNPKQLPGDLSIENSELTLVHTSDGLVCLSLTQPEAETAYICNPIMGECIMLPKHQVNHNDYHSVQYGVGICRSTNKYKVLRIVLSWQEHDKGLAEVLTLGIDDAWRDLPNPVISAPNIEQELYSVNGVIHWLFLDKSRIIRIKTFDLAEEKCGEMVNPLGFGSSFFRYYKLTVFDDRLCLVDYIDDVFTGPLAIDIWKQKEYGVTNSWTKDIRIECPIPRTLKNLVLVAISRNGEIVLRHSWSAHIIVYNPGKETFKHLAIGYCGILGYAPTFLSLNDVLRGRDWSTMNVQSM